MDRVTLKTLEQMVKHINSLEYHLNPQDIKNHKTIDLWCVDYYPNLGVYIRRGYANPTQNSSRLTMNQAYMFLCGITYALEFQYNKLSTNAN